MANSESASRWIARLQPGVVKRNGVGVKGSRGHTYSKYFILRYVLVRDTVRNVPIDVQVLQYKGSAGSLNSLRDNPAVI